jgi:hypothetical protein
MPNAGEACEIIACANIRIASPAILVYLCVDKEREITRRKIYCACVFAAFFHLSLVKLSKEKIVSFPF